MLFQINTGREPPRFRNLRADREPRPASRHLSLCQYAEDLVLAHDEVFLTIDLHFGT